MCRIVDRRRRKGSGKSTALRRLAYVIAGSALASNETAHIPVLVRAIDIARADGDLVTEPRAIARPGRQDQRPCHRRDGGVTDRAGAKGQDARSWRKRYGVTRWQGIRALKIAHATS